MWEISVGLCFSSGFEVGCAVEVGDGALGSNLWVLMVSWSRGWFNCLICGFVLYEIV